MNVKRVVAVVVLLVMFVACAPGSLLRPMTGRESTHRQRREACEQALKYGWCGNAYRQCRRKPDSCKPGIGINVGVSGSVGLTGGGVGRRRGR